MSEWNTEPLGALASFQKGRKVDTSDYLRPGYDTYLGASSLEGTIDGYASKALAVLADETDVLMLWDGERSGLVGHGLNGVVSSTVSRLSPASRITGTYLYYHLLSRFEWIQGRRTGTGVPHVPKDLARILKVDYPVDLREQDGISDVLRAIDSTIDKTESLITKYQQIKAGLMHDLFTRGVTADGKLRPPREQAPELYQETPIGWIPREWDALQLDQISKIIDPQPDHRTPPEQQDGIPYVGIGDFDTFGEIDESACRKIVISAYMRQASRFNTEEGDIIYGKIGTIGHPKKIPDGSYALSANVLLIKPDINKSFIYHALSTSYFEKQIVNITNTTSQPALGIERFRKLLVSLPQGDEQHMIASQLDAVDVKLSSESTLAQKLKMKKAGLMHDLLTGEVRIKPNKVGKEVVNE